MVAETRYHGITGDEFLGDGINVVYVMGREHQRFFFDAGWSKERMQEHLWPRLTADTAGFHDRRVNLGHPENILIVAAGGAVHPQTLTYLGPEGTPQTGLLYLTDPDGTRIEVMSNVPDLGRVATQG